MIAQLSGTVEHVGTSALVLDVQGVGYRLLATPTTLAELHVHQEALLYTHLVVREDSMTLYGFRTFRERDMFETLQSVQGVGPRLALALLAVHEPDALGLVIEAGDRKALERVPGVGAKVAARLLLELAGKLVRPDDDVAVQAEVADAREQVVDALVSLGWNAKSAQAAVDVVAAEPIVEADVPATLRAALQRLGGPRG